MYPNFIVANAVDHLLHNRWPFDQLDDRMLADLGLDRQGRFVDPGDHRRPALAEKRQPAGLLAWIRAALSAPWHRRPVL